MDLIKKLGGYEKAKSYVVDANACGAFDDENKIKSALLEYRRANNIFEVGDKVVLLGDGTWGHLFEVEKMSPKGRKPTKLKTDVFGNFHVGYNVVRHATDAEIKAGHRL